MELDRIDSARQRRSTLDDRTSTVLEANEKALSTEKRHLGDTTDGRNPQDGVTVDGDEYPNVIRRTIIVVGVAIALFLV